MTACIDIRAGRIRKFKSVLHSKSLVKMLGMSIGYGDSKNLEY